MAETAAPLRTVPDKPGQPETDGKDGNDRFGRALDVTAIAAAVVLGVVIFDMISGGKVKRLFTRKRGGCGCQDETPEPSGDS